MSSIPIFTKRGDSGYTSLLSREQLPKDAPIVMGLGSLDETSSLLGMVVALFKKDMETRDWTWEIELMEWLQDKLYTISARTAWTGVQAKPARLPELQQEDIEFLEAHIERMNKDLPVLRNFCLLGGSELVSLIHYARTVCRRAECHFAAISREYNLDPCILPFLNRLSDHLFIFARWVGFQRNEEEKICLDRKIPKFPD